jgi:hypothetical protein
VIEEWMQNIADNPRAGVAANKPAAAVDSCFDDAGDLIYAGADAWDGILDDSSEGPCAAQFEIFSNSRIVGIVEYLAEVDLSRQRARKAIRDDGDLLKSISVPSGEPCLLVDVLLETLVKASDYRGRAVAASKILFGASATGFII